MKNIHHIWHARYNIQACGIVLAVDARLTFWIDYEAFDGASLQLSVYEVIQCLRCRQKHKTLQLSHNWRMEEGGRELQLG